MQITKKCNLKNPTFKINGHPLIRLLLENMHFSRTPANFICENFAPLICNT